MGAKKASKLLIKLRKQKLVNVAGILLLNDIGRPTIIYGPDCDKLSHSVFVTDIAIALKAWIDPGVKFGRTVCDGLILKGGAKGTRVHLEADHSMKETKDQWQQKLAKFPEKSDDFVLVVTHTQGRKVRLAEWSASRKDLLLFATLDDLRHGRPAVDCGGRPAAL